MGSRILIIVNAFLYEFVKTMLSDFQTDCDVRVISFHDFKQIPEIYEENRSWADGVLINGRIAHAALEKAYPEHGEPFLYFDPTLICVYQKIIDLFVICKKLDTHRVILDFLLPFYGEPTVDYFLQNLEMQEVSDSINEWIADASFAHFPLLQKQLVEKISELWNAGKTDCVICTYGSIVPELKKRGIAHQYILPEASRFQSLFTELQMQIQIRRMHDNLPAVIAVSYMDRDCSPASMQKLHCALTELKKDCAINYIIHEMSDRYYLYTSLKAVNLLTDHCRHSFFPLALQQKYHIHAAVGYGIGNDITTAKAHANIAIREAVFSGASFLLDEKQNLIGPLNSTQTLTVAHYASEATSNIAKKCRLSSLTIQKVDAVIRQTGSNLMTAQKLAEHLCVTSRNANRILTSLQKGGYASISCTQPASTKGRPEKVYKLFIEIQ